MLLLANNTKVVCEKLILGCKCANFRGTRKIFLAQIPSLL